MVKKNPVATEKFLNAGDLSIVTAKKGVQSLDLRTFTLYTQQSQPQGNSWSAVEQIVLPSTDFIPEGTINKYGATEFTQLTDVPQAYTGQALKLTRVNAAETGLEFFSLSGSGIMDLNGLNAAVQTFSKVDDTNMSLTITSAVADHGFALAWVGTLADGRIASSATWNAKLTTVAVDGVTITGDGTGGNPLVAVSGGGETLAQTLAIGNTTGGNNVVISNGDLITGSGGQIQMDFGNDLAWVLTTDGGVFATPYINATTTSIELASLGGGGLLLNAGSSSLAHSILVNIISPQVYVSSLTGSGDGFVLVDNAGTLSYGLVIVDNVTVTGDGTAASPLVATGSGGTVTSVASADGSITVTNPTTTVDLAVVKAPILTTARTIGGVSFNGSINIVPQTIESANEATDTTCFPLFITASGTQQLQPKNNTGFIYNSNINSLTATTFVGALTGNASTATNVTVGGVVGLGTGVPTALAVNVGTAGAFVVNGGVLGTPSSATLTNATGLPSILIANEATDTTCFINFTTGATGELGIKSNANLTFNSNTASLACTTFVGAFTGNVSGTAATFTGNLTGDVTSVAMATTLATAQPAVHTWALTQTFTVAPVISAMTLGSVLFAGASGIVSQDNAALFWDDTNNTLYSGGNSGAFTATPLHTTGTTNSYLQNNIRNLSNGNSASSDFIATADNGTDSTFYVDFGINSSTYNNASYTITGINDAYLYSQSSNLAIGTATAAKSLLFHTGGTLAANERMRVSDTEVYHLVISSQILAPASNVTVKAGYCSIVSGGIYTIGAGLSLTIGAGGNFKILT